MTDIERLDERLTAVERAVVDGDYELDELADLAAVADDVDRLDSRLDDIEDRLATVEARSQSVEGFVGQVRSVNEDVEQQADAAIAAVDRLERRIAELEALTEGATRGGRGTPRESGRASTDGAQTAERSVDRVVSGREPGTPRPDAGGGRGAAGNGQQRRDAAGGHARSDTGHGRGGDGGRVPANDRNAGSPEPDADAGADQETLADEFELEGEDDDDDDGLLTTIRSKLP